MTTRTATTVLPEGVENEVAPLGGGATSAPQPCACPLIQGGNRLHGWDCPDHPRHRPYVGTRATLADWFSPRAFARRSDEDDHDPDGRLADAEAARVYGGRDVD